MVTDVQKQLAVECEVVGEVEVELVVLCLGDEGLARFDRKEIRRHMDKAWGFGERVGRKGLARLGGHGVRLDLLLDVYQDVARLLLGDEVLLVPRVWRNLDALDSDNVHALFMRGVLESQNKLFFIY